jgi:hypothetical protein
MKEVDWKKRYHIFKESIALMAGINLSSNCLSSDTPPKLTNLEGIRFLNLSRNHLTSGIPKDLGNM